MLLSLWKGQKMINKILRLFGLIKISRAKHLSGTLHLYYIKRVSRWAKEDFGRDIPLDLLPKGHLWWTENLDNMILSDADHVMLDGD